MYEGNHLASCLRASSAASGGRRFLSPPEGRARSFDASFAAAEKYADALMSLGVRPGDRVAALVEKSPAAIELYLGTILAGGAFLPLNPGYTPDEVDFFIRDARPWAFVVDPGRQESLAGTPAMATVPAVATLDSSGDGSLEQFGRENEERSGFRPAARKEDDLAAILYTSGTTGRPKGAMLTHANLSTNALTLADCWRFTSRDVLVHALPIFHTHGLFVATNVALVAGAAVEFLPEFGAEAVLACMRRATVLMGVPTFYSRLLEHPELGEAASGMRLFISGSAPLPVSVHEAWRIATGQAILERYGMTETGMNTSNPCHGERRAGTVGTPLPGITVRLGAAGGGRDGGDSPAGDGAIGILEVAGPNVFPGYWMNEEATARDFTDDGYFVTGDIARIDDDGYVTIVGRSGDVVISGGFNIYPSEVERVIDAAPGVREVAVVGVPHHDLGEAAVAVVVRDSDGTDTGTSAEAILAHAAERLARYKQPRRIVFRDNLPRNAMGKVLKKRLTEEFAKLFAPR